MRFNVSIHAPAWGATGGVKITFVAGYVSIHAPAWGATDARRRFTFLDCVSIHAPAWGATPDSRPAVDPRVFQSTPPHGGRPLYRTKKVKLSCFNPRPRMGGDIYEACQPCLIPVSIHAPAWGATCAEQSHVVSMQFQSTPPHGGRLE